MKRLILVRHGKSSWDNNLPDDQRPLKKRGEKDGLLIANAFLNSVEPPLTLWSSPAVRALETAKIFKKTLNIGNDNFIIKDPLYTFNSNDLLRQIQECNNEIETLMVFGHNPAMTNLVNNLGSISVDNVPTTGLTVVDFECDRWENIKKGKTTLSLFPKNLRDN